jgi:hypothetical protein
MKIHVPILCLCCLLAAPAWGQEVEKEKSGHGYVFVAPGAATTFSCRSCTAGTIHFGGGGETTFYKGLGIGAEIGYLGAMEDLSAGFGLLSINGVYIFRGRGHSRWEPFLTGGGTLAMGQGEAAGAVNFGGGVQYWLKNRIGLRIEFRDHVPNQDFSSHLFEGRIGFSFR